MRKSKNPPIPSSQITPKELFVNRRNFLKTATIALGSISLAACNLFASKDLAAPSAESTQIVDELGDRANSFEDVTHYNNYYEFSTNKSAVAGLAKNFQTQPWNIHIFGLVNEEKIYDLDDLKRKFPSEERVYRLRCVEGWSMVIPWVGLPLARLLRDVEPTSNAGFVRFETLDDPKRLPREASPAYPWPYQEGLRLDEALNDLTILAYGMYGGELPAQNGGGLRLVVPWKYGFKSIKAVVNIELVEEKPETYWNTIAPREYGFYANVNPQVPHPRWPQSTERRIGEASRRDTLLFNGYSDQVASMYAGMDLVANY